MVLEHYVPRSYLRNFAPESGDLVSRYSLVETHGGGGYHSPVDRYPIKKSGAIEGFVDGWFENDETARIEREMAESIRKVISDRSLSGQNIANISQFIAFQTSRTPQAILHHNSRQKLPIQEGRSDELPRYFDQKWKNVLYYNANEGHESLQFMGWRVIENETEVPFITSDKPVVHSFQQDFEEISVTNMELHGREIFCPLDSGTLLMLLDPELFRVDSQWPETKIKRLEITNPKEVHRFNLLQGVNAFQEVFGPVGEGSYLERIIELLCRAFPHENFIRGNREDLDTIQKAHDLATGMRTQSEIELYLNKYKPVIHSQRLKSHAIWAFNHQLKTIDMLLREDPRSGYWDRIESGADPRDLS